MSGNVLDTIISTVPTIQLNSDENFSAPVHEELLKHSRVEELLAEVYRETGMKPIFQVLSEEKCREYDVVRGRCEYLPFNGEFCGIRIRYDKTLETRLAKQVLLVEMCNALFMKTIFRLDQQLLKNKISPVELSVEKEKIERKAVLRSLKIADEIDVEIMSDVDVELVNSSVKFLDRMADTGHTKRYVTEAEKMAEIKKGKSGSLQPSAGVLGLSAPSELAMQSNHSHSCTSTPAPVRAGETSSSPFPRILRSFFKTIS